MRGLPRSGGWWAAPAAVLVMLARPVDGAAQPPAHAPSPIVHYPLLSGLADETGRHPALIARNAPVLGGRGLYCNGIGAPDSAAMDGCDVRTPFLGELDTLSFTISATFVVPPSGPGYVPVVVGGARWRWLAYQLLPGGAIALETNAGDPVACSVRYRPGVWHEATITWDGRRATLFLDGVAGCHADVSLRFDDDRTVLLRNPGSGSTFYGLLKDLRVFNGIATPARRQPEADTLPPPPPPHLSPADRFLTRCPTAGEIAAIDNDLRLTFEGDPTSGAPLACTAAAGSRDLSPLARRVYLTLLLARRLSFDQPLPWTRESLYGWLTAAIEGIRFRTDIAVSSCCDPPRTINVRVDAISNVARTDRWAEPALRGGLDGFLLLIVHEARHAEGRPHTCGSNDQTVDELGAWSVQYYLARWLAEHTDQAFFTGGPIRYPKFLLDNAEQLRRTRFCTP